MTAYILGGCAIAILIGVFTKSWMSGRGGLSGVGPLGIEVCFGGVCQGNGWTGAPGDVQLIAYFALIAGIAAAGACGYMAFLTLSNAPNRFPAFKIINGALGLGAAGTTFFLVRLLIEGQELSISWSPVFGIGGVIAGGIFVRKLRPYWPGQGNMPWPVAVAARPMAQLPPGGGYPPGQPYGQQPYGAPPMGAPPMGAAPMGAAPMGAPPMGAPPSGPPMGPGAYGAPMGAPPMGAAPMGAPPMGAPPMGALSMGAPPMGAAPHAPPPAAPMGPPYGAPMGAPPMGAAPMGAPPMGAPPMGAPPSGPPMGPGAYGTPMGAPPMGSAPGAPPLGAPMNAPPMAAPAQVPMRTNNPPPPGAPFGSAAPRMMEGGAPQNKATILGAPAPQLAAILKQQQPAQPAAATPAAVTPAAGAQFCGRCGKPMTFVAQHQRWFCQGCQQYA